MTSTPDAAPTGTPASSATAPGPRTVPFTDPGVTLIHGDARTALATLKPDSIDVIITDPPYGLSREPDAAEVLSHWLAGDDYAHPGNGFMGHSWDSFVPGPNVWREAFRVLKPGGHAFVFASPRTADLMTIALRLAGFEVRDSIHWTYGAGFPKSLDVARAFGKAGDEANADRFAGYGTALKPSHEPVIVVRKPLRGTVIANAAAYGTGALNIDACRVTGVDPTEVGEEPAAEADHPAGRFPANTVFTHAADCREVGTTTVKAPVINRFVDGAKPFGGGAGHAFESVRTGDADGNETLAVFDCAPGCPVAELDAQSGILTSGKPGTYRGTPNRSAAYGAESRKAGEAMTGFGDSGGASRFFPKFKYAQKASPDERVTVYVPAGPCVSAGHSPDPHDPATGWAEAASPTAVVCPACGSDWEPYQHPTVKPLDGLTDWLISLGVPPDGTVLDCFAGTGTTGVAAIAEGHPVVLIEQDPVHVAMIHKRVTEPIQTSLFSVA